jgi:hypothetical protein
MKVKDENIDVSWRPRYSSNMDDDDIGRWARVAYAGFTKDNFPFKDGMVTVWEIAWIKKLKDPTTKEPLGRFIISPDFPFKGTHIFVTLEDAQAEVEKHFRHFIKCCIK